MASAAAGEAELKEGFPQKKETPRSSLDETHNRGYCEGTPYWAYLQNKERTHAKAQDTAREGEGDGDGDGDGERAGGGRGRGTLASGGSS